MRSLLSPQIPLVFILSIRTRSYSKKNLYSFLFQKSILPIKLFFYKRGKKKKKKKRTWEREERSLASTWSCENVIHAMDMVNWSRTCPAGLRRRGSRISFAPKAIRRKEVGGSGCVWWTWSRIPGAIHSRSPR